MRYYAGLDVSLAETSVCVVDEDGRILREAKVASEPEALATWLGGLGLPLTRVGLETGALAGWLCEEMTELGVPNVVCMDANRGPSFESLLKLSLQHRGAALSNACPERRKGPDCSGPFRTPSGGPPLRTPRPVTCPTEETAIRI